MAAAFTIPGDNDLEAVFQTLDAAEVTVVRSLFDAAEIPYITRGEDRYDAFRGAFRGTVFSSEGRPVVFLVPSGRAEEARKLLEDTEAD